MNTNRNYTDMMGGAMLILIGLGAAFYASGRYDIGTLSEMGPGMFPTAIGYLLAGLGVLIAVPAFFREGALPKAEWRPFFAVILGVLAFALTVDTIGMVGALVLLVAFAISAHPQMGWVGNLVLTASIILAAWLLFRLGLDIPIPVFKSPF